MPHASEIGGELERIRQAVDAIERRLTRVEHALAGHLGPRPADGAAVREPSGAVHGPQVQAATVRPPPLPARAATFPPRVPFAEVSVARPAGVEPPPVPSTRLESPTRSLEELIGQNWASWVGAVVLFLGVVFFLKYAWDQGWLVVPPAARVGAAIAAGGALAAAGEWVHRRSMRALAGTLYGAGAAVVIAAFFAACAYFEPPVIAPRAAFAAVAVTAALSVVVALRVNVSVVAVIGLLGAYLAPNLLAGTGDRSTFFITYLATLTAAALALAQFKPAWASPRWLALAGTYVWLWTWWYSTGARFGHESLAIGALVGFPAAFVAGAAMVVRGHRRQWDADERHAATAPQFHALGAALVSIVASMLLLVVAWNDASRLAVTSAAVAMAALLAGPGMVLNHRRPAWVAFRWAVVACSYGWLALAYLDAGFARIPEWVVRVWALSLYGSILVENVMTLRRRDEANVGVPVAAASIVSMAACLGVFLWLRGAINPALVGAIALALASVQSLAGVLARSRDYFVSSVLQAAALVTLAVPLVLDEFAVTLAWIVLAAVLGLAAWQLNLPKARGWAAALLLLALARLFIYDQSNTQMTATEFHVLGQPVARWMLSGWTIAVMFHLLVWLRPGAGHWPALEARIGRVVPAAPSPACEARAPLMARSPVLRYASVVRDALVPQTGAAAAETLDRAGALLAAAGTVVFAAVTLLEWSGPPVTLALIGWLGALLLLETGARRFGYALQAWVLGAAVTIGWLVLDNLVPLSVAWDRGGGAPPLINLPALCGLLLAAAAVLAARTTRDLVNSDRRNALVVWAAAVLFCLLNFETIRFVDTFPALGDRAIVKQVAMSVLWALVGFGGILFGFRSHLATVRWAALALLGVTLAKILVIDMAEVKAIWRILSFVAVGLLLLCVSFVYHRQVDTESVDDG